MTTCVFLISLETSLQFEFICMASLMIVQENIILINDKIFVVGFCLICDCFEIINKSHFSLIDIKKMKAIGKPLSILFRNNPNQSVQLTALNRTMNTGDSIRRERKKY